VSDKPVLLEVEDLQAGFGSQPVLHGVSFRVREGEIGAILGLNGAGKSVTLKVVGGILPAWAGHVRLGGADVTHVPAEERVARGLAHVPQGRQVFPDLTVEQNLRLGAYTLRRRDRTRYASVLDGVLQRFPRLAERRGQQAGTLSGGEQAMLAVGRALMSEPKLVLVDEASAGLAPIAVEALFETLREVNRSGVTILMVEQNVTFTLRLADRAHIMQQGVIVYDGDVATLDQERVASLLGVGRLLGRHVAAAADKRRAPVQKGSPNGAPKRKRAPAKPRTRAAAVRKTRATAPKTRAAAKRAPAAAKRGKAT
jgi:branched-chain amino acid transport system ATP-binding protein